LAKPREPINPFYVASGILGVAFTLTACAYGILMLQANRGMMRDDALGQDHPLLSLLNMHGVAILAIEVLLLGIASIAAIVLDHYRGRRSMRKESSGDHPT
jgi:ABC-type uncharacterized transport system permease subunit